MQFTRRRLLQLTAAASITGGLPRPTLAEAPLGSGTLTTVSDGHLVLPGDLIFGPMPQDELPAVLAEFGVPADRLEPECNLALYRDGTNTVLFDVGSGPDFMPSAGMLLDNLAAAGLTPGDVSHVIFTHAHPDHIWGVLDLFDEIPFPNAAFMMGRAEWDYWWNPETVDTIGQARQSFAVGAKRRMEALEDRTAFFDDGDEVLPGIAAVASFGHTPGHMSFEIRNGSDVAMVIGDAIGNHHVAFARSDWPSGSDQDPETAIASRVALLDRLASEQMLAVGFHLPGGGIGRVAQADGRYRFVQD